MIYFSGVVVSAIICIVLTAVKQEVRLSDLLSAVINIACSWATPITLLGIGLNTLLNTLRKNPVIWKKKADQQQTKIIRKKQ